MKNLKFLVLVLILLFTSSAVSQEKSYQIVLRGGGNLNFSYNPFSNFASGPQIWITFAKGPQGVGENWEHRHTLEPGQGAWRDKPIKDQAPNRIILILGKKCSHGTVYYITLPQERFLVDFLENLHEIINVRQAQ